MNLQLCSKSILLQDRGTVFFIRIYKAGQVIMQSRYFPTAGEAQEWAAHFSRASK